MTAATLRHATEIIFISFFSRLYVLYGAGYAAYHRGEQLEIHG